MYSYFVLGGSYYFFENRFDCNCIRSVWVFRNEVFSSVSESAMNFHQLYNRNIYSNAFLVGSCTAFYFSLRRNRKHLSISFTWKILKGFSPRGVFLFAEDRLRYSSVMSNYSGCIYSGWVFMKMKKKYKPTPFPTHFLSSLKKQ